MELTEIEKLLIGVLKFCGADKNMIVPVCLLLQNSSEAQKNLLFWIVDRNPELKEMSREELGDILLEALRIHNSLPKELQIPRNQAED